jgi:hypothetical protein
VLKILVSMATIQRNQLKQCAPFYKVLMLLIAFVILMQVDAMAECDPPTGVPNFSCGTGSTTISANSPNAGTFRWYDSPTDGTLLRTSAANVTTDNYSTAVINVTTTFYVSFSDGNCESPRTPVDASILPSLSDPPNVASTALCGPGSVTLTVTSPTDGSNPIPGRFRWYSAPTGGTFITQSSPNQVSSSYPTGTILSTTTYYVTFTGRCTESIRKPITATVNTIPGPPSNVIPGSACGGSVFPLFANATEARTFNWYTAATGGSLLQTSSSPSNVDSFMPPSLPTVTTTYHVSLADANTGCESTRTPVTFTVSDSAPSTFTVGNGSRCGPGVVTVNASTSSGTGVFRWYSSQDSGTTLQPPSGTVSNNNYSPTISETTVYYVSYTRGGCVSNRSAVTATIIPRPSPILVPGSGCGSGAVTLTATSEIAGTFRWFNALTGGSLLQTSPLGVTTNDFNPSITATTTYFVEFQSGTCASLRSPITATVNNLPSQPSVVPGSSCGGSTAALRAISDVAGTFNWYKALTGGSPLKTSESNILNDSFTPSTLPASTTDYYVTITEAVNGCESSRIPVTFSINTEAPATPSAPGGGGANCGTGSVPLSASSGSAGLGRFRWYDNDSSTLLQTSGPSVSTSSYSTPVLSVTTDFYVTFTKPNGCVSRLTPVKATISLPPPAPTPVPGANCGPGIVTLSATSSESGTFRWYNNSGSLVSTSTGGLITHKYEPSLSATTTFFVTFSNAACESSPRTPVVATINTLPAAPSVISGSNCAGSIAALSASSTIPSTFKWYSASTGGDLLQTSAEGVLTNSFTPSPSPASTTDYFVTRTDLNGCESNPRTSVSFSVNLASPITPTVIAPPALCGSGPVTLTANSGSAQGTFRWFTSPDGGIPFSVSGSNFVTHSTTPNPNPSATTTYYVSFTPFLTNCVSNRIPIVATINPLSVVSSVVPGQRCGVGSVTLSATSSTPGIFRWFTVSTGGVPVQQSLSPQTSTTFVTPSLNSSVLYFVTFDNGSICGPSTPRTPVTASIISGIAPTVGTEARCGSGTVTLSANATISGTFNWFTSLTGGTPIQTSANRTFDSFVTPVLNSSTTYYVTHTASGCESARIPVVASIALKANFDLVGICNGNFTKFIDKTDAAQGSVLSYTWRFGNNKISTPNGIDINADVPLTTDLGVTKGTYKNPQHKFPNAQDYTVVLTASAGPSCKDSLTKTVRILGVTKVGESVEWRGGKSGEGYFKWFPQALADTLNDWRLASTINGKQIKTNDSSWWTGGNKRKILENSYQNNQSAAINIDQCLDISKVKRPMISLNYWSDFELNSDGAVMQYSIDNGTTWEIVKIDSLEDAGINWFNGKTILANPGQQKIQVPFLSFGWTGRTNGWRRAAYNLDMIPKEKRDTVRFRIAMATGSTNANDNEGNGVYEGFAFNNVYIGEKKRQVLVEHFTNSKDVSSQKADAYLDALFKRQESLRGVGNADFNSIRYYIRNGNTNDDPLHLDNPTDPGQRAAVYGVTKPPSTFMGGRSFGNITNNIAANFNYKVIDRRALQPPKFTLKLDTVETLNSTTITPRLTITSDTIVNASLVAQVALIENNVKEDKYGSRTYQNVLRKLLFGSDPTKRDGVNISSNYFNNAGITRTIEQTVDIDTYISNGNNLMLVGFVLDNLTGENYRSVVITAPKKVGKKMDPITGMDDTSPEHHQLKMYPNPVANGKLYLSVPKEFLAAGNWKIADQRGVFVEKGDFESTVEGTKTIDVSQLANGVYFVWISVEGKTPIYRKLVIINRQ